MNDDDLLDAVRAALADDRPSERALAAARAADTWRDVDAELAELLDDSASGLEVVRDGESRRSMSFAGTSGVFEVVVTGRAVEVVVEPVPDELSLETTSGPSIVADDPGRGRFPVSGGPVRIRAAWGDRTATTDWFTV